MTVEEFLQEIALEYDLDGKPYYPDKYKIVKEEYNEVYEKYNITENIEIDINHNTKQIIILD